jgi:hypothetical protein
VSCLESKDIRFVSRAQGPALPTTHRTEALSRASTPLLQPPGRVTGYCPAHGVVWTVRPHRPLVDSTDHKACGLTGYCPAHVARSARVTSAAAA